jgi:hypothetical protein
MAFIRNNNNNGRRHNNNYNNRHRHNNQQGSQGNNQQRRFTNRANQVFDSNGPDGRVRGTAVQLVEKYSQMARDTSSRDDRVTMISYWQHAEHYQRLVNEIAEETAVIEREREVQRALHAAQNPSEAPPPFEPLDPIAAAEGFPLEAPHTANTANAPQPREQRPQRQPRQQQPVEAQGEEDNALPSFLQPDAKPQPRQQSRGRRPQNNADDQPAVAEGE